MWEEAVAEFKSALQWLLYSVLPFTLALFLVLGLIGGPIWLIVYYVNNC